MWVVTTIWKNVDTNRPYANTVIRLGDVYSALGSALLAEDCLAVIVFNTKTKTTETHFPEGDK